MNCKEVLQKHNLSGEDAKEVYDAMKREKYIRSSLYRISQSCGIALNPEKIRKISEEYPLDAEVDFSILIEKMKND